MIDTSGCFAQVPEVPLVVPEVNGGIIERISEKRFVAVAGGAAAALTAVLKPLDEVAGLRAVSAATYEPASGSGRAGVSELGGQTVGLLGGQYEDEAEFSHRLAFNCVPAIGEIDAEGYSESERELGASLRRPWKPSAP